MNRIYGLHEINNAKCVIREERAVEKNVVFLLRWIHCFFFLWLIYNINFVWKLFANILSLTYNNIVSQKFPALFASKYLGPGTTENHTIKKQYKNSEILG
jgi:hypothetical protein